MSSLRLVGVAVVLPIAWSAGLFAREPSAASALRPNIVVILADDLGIECLTAYGGRSHATPHIDALARQGMRFTHCFSNPTCSPSRATLLTGRYPFRNGMTEVIYDLERHANTFLHTDQPSFPRQLKKAGYATAIAGKWQLSFLRKRDTICDFGFDQYQCWQILDPDGSRTARFAQPYFRQNGVVIADEIRDRYGPDLNVEFLTAFMKSKASENQPFLAYYTCLLPHFPWEQTPDSVERSDKPPAVHGKGDRKYFPDMVAYLDKQVGQLLEAVADAGITDDTVVMFLADNGTDVDLRHRFENGAMIPGGKCTMTDRGTRVPLIVRWPGHVQAGSTCDDLVDFTDFFPTLCDLAGAPLPDAKLDGQSFGPQLLGQPATPRAWVHYQNKEERVVRDREFMLTNRGELRRVVEIWENPPAKALSNDTPEERLARERLQKVFDDLGPQAAR